MNLDRFNQIKSTLKTADCLLWSGADIISDLIEDISRSQYSHAGLVMVFEEYPDLIFTVEAQGSGVLMADLAQRLRTSEGGCTVFPLNADLDPRRREMGERALKMLGTPYDYGALLKLAVEKVKTGEREVVCSEMVQEVYGIQGDILTPGELPRLGIFGPAIKL
jgi:hypothetical protein